MVVSVSESQREYCETEGCHRKTDVLLHLGIGESTLDDGDNTERWSCGPCHRAMQLGNTVPGGNIQVMEYAE